VNSFSHSAFNLAACYMLAELGVELSRARTSRNPHAISDRHALSPQVDVLRWARYALNVGMGNECLSHTQVM
jgi:hypothetical protein